MSVVRKNESLADSEITKITDVKVSGDGTGDGQKKEKNTKPEKKKKKKKGFIRTTIQELRKVNWPSWKYTLRWSGVVIIFAFIMSITLGFFDHVLSSGIGYVDCTAEYRTTKDSDDETEKADKNYGECGQQLIDELVFKGE